MLTLVGLGLCDGTDITLRGKRAVSDADAVYLEGYTSLLQCTHEELEEELECSITQLDRAGVEKDIDAVLAAAKATDVVLLVIGDPFAATTHHDLVLRARNAGVQVKVVHNSSILTAVGEVGLDLYRFGRTVSIPFWQPGYEPTSFVDNIVSNGELHTLCLLDIQAAEGRFMSVREGIAFLRQAEERTGKKVTQGLIVGVARLGCADQEILAGTAEELVSHSFGRPPHCLIIPGKLHDVESEMLDQWKA